MDRMMEDFSGLALPPLFGGHILEAELEPGGVELGPGEVELGPGVSELLEGRGQGSGTRPEQQQKERRELEKRKYLALIKRCKEIEQVNEKILGRLHQVQRLTRRMKKERRFLMKTLDAHGDDYRNAQLTISLEWDPRRRGIEFQNRRKTHRLKQTSPCWQRRSSVTFPAQPLCLTDQGNGRLLVGGEMKQHSVAWTPTSPDVMSLKQIQPGLFGMF
ncbi:TCF3 fusion partner homolog isoform X3 [Salmo salar]|uniref:TCF3 fusion partner homolog isoform X3 n=1 Tax=Salmo salar TaxID=8030 RepID=A0ABM3CZQ8_SALSA|nr:TCF3 fusion partner homolog isoform X3 [Salmo salar]